eukprot:1160080-Pelagomonas_calceolata.AAC.12
MRAGIKKRTRKAKESRHKKKDKESKGEQAKGNVSSTCTRQRREQRMPRIFFRAITCAMVALLMEHMPSIGQGRKPANCEQKGQVARSTQVARQAVVITPGSKSKAGSSEHNR